jgi:hypothetical protein
MHCDLWPFLTPRLMGLGYTLHEAEYISNRLLAVVLFVVTLLGYTIVGEESPTRQDQKAYIHTNITGRRSGFLRTASSISFVLEAGREHPRTL